MRKQLSPLFIRKITLHPIGQISILWARGGAPINISKDISAKKNIERRDEERKTTFYNFTHPYGKFANPTVRASVTDRWLETFLISTFSLNFVIENGCRALNAMAGGGGGTEDGKREKKRRRRLTALSLLGFTFERTFF